MNRNTLRLALSLLATLGAAPAVAESVTGSVSPPLSGVNVQVRETVDQRLGDPGPVTLGRDGSFTLPWRDRGLLLEVGAPGHRNHLRWIGRLPQAPVGVDLVPETDQVREPAESARGTNVRGQVLDARGEPVPEAEVGVVRIDFRSFTGLSVPVVPEGAETEVTTLEAGADGRFAFRLDRHVDLPGEDRAALALTCRLPGRVAGTRAVRRLPSQELDCRIGGPGNSLSGRLTGADAETPWPLHVMAATPNAPLTATVVTGPGGRFTTPEIFPGDVPGFLVLLDVPEARPEVLIVEAGHEKEIEVPMRPGVDLPVRLVDAETGRSPERAAVSAWMTLGPLRLERQATPERTLRHLPPETSVEVRVAAPGYLPHRQTVDLGSAPSDPLVVRLEPAARLEVRVTGPRGAAVAGARVEIAPDSGEAVERENPAVAALSPPIPPEEAVPDTFAVTDADGRAVFESWPLGRTATVTCRAPGYAPWWREGVRVNEREERIEIALERGAVIEPRVDELELVGEPYLGAAPPPLPVADGDLVSGVTFFLRAPVDVRLWLDGDDDLLPARELRLTAIRRWDGIPFYGERHTVAANPEADGSFLVENLAADVYDLEVRVPGARPLRREEVRLVGPETTLVFDDLEIGALMALSVVDTAGRGIEGAKARLFRLTPNETEGPSSGTLYDVPEDHPDLRTVSTDSAGEAVFDGLEAGDYQLHVRDASGRYAYETWTLGQSEADGLVERQVVLPEGEDVPVEITAAGQPATHAVVVLIRQEQGFEGIRHETQTDLAGRGRFENVVPGTYRLVIHFTDPLLAGREPEPSWIRVEPGARLLLEL